MKIKNKNLSITEKKVADQVADDLLTVDVEEEDRRYFFLLLFFFICLIFLISTISFAIIDTYNNGSSNNAIDVGVDVDVDNTCTKNCDTDGDGLCDKYCDNNSVEPISSDNDGTNSNSTNNYHHPSINPGTILFSFNEGSNYINILNAMPTSDYVGMNLSGDKEYFDFGVSVSFDKKNVPVTYEITAVPNTLNSLSEDDVRVYLTANGNGVSTLSDSINNFSDLPDSTISANGKVLFTKTITEDDNTDYVFRMWLSSKAKVSSDSKKFGCKIIVNGYYED